MSAYVEARTFFERAVTIARRLDGIDPLEIATDMERSGEACMRVGETRRALAHFAGARKFGAAEHVLLAEVELATARAAHRVGGAEPSMRWLRAARHHLDDFAGDALPLRTAIETEEAFARFTSGHLHAAERWCRIAIEHAREIGDDVALAKSLHLLDMIRVARGVRDDEAIATEALDAATRAGDNIRRCQILIHLGARAYLDGDWPRALRRYEDARVAGAQGGDVWLSAIVTSNIGEILLEQGRYGECEPALREAHDVFRAADTPSPLAFTQTLLGRLCCATGRTPEGTVFLDSARTLYASLHLDGDVHDVGVRLAEAAVIDGRATDALAMVGDDSPVSQRVRALALRQLGRDTEAIAALRASAGGSPYDRYLALDLLDRWVGISDDEHAEADGIARQLGLRTTVIDLTATLSPSRSAGHPAAAGT